MNRTLTAMEMIQMAMDGLLKVESLLQGADLLLPNGDGAKEDVVDAGNKVSEAIASLGMVTK
jgi:hypothetical protein